MGNRTPTTIDEAGGAIVISGGPRGEKTAVVVCSMKTLISPGRRHDFSQR
jgi:hypothetical protein